ncbi:ABC transporter ATP-binding protein [Sporolituus thermophilus]|uniref:NitT/TauT family transport system ATP-binding protein n=2 Tax=Bacteria TaxID=2 RepID=A0A1G7KIH6_9FIRM|nr:ABC transporter ATP-binding protein [Sporolituus thermophilus]SDF37002.1 NitT/TauT family transport system ATP-binding protein [Sporolituus thermophilus DSM 23256]
MKVVIEQVSKAYPGRYGRQLCALKDINLTVHDEEFIVLVGPSGCGKSTLLNMVGGLLSPTSGKIYVEGLKDNRDPVIGIVFQDVGLFPWRTVSQNIAFGLEECGLSKQEQRERIEYYVSLVGLEGFENAFPHQLSGGMRQRVGIARALAIQPDLLLMDEPFSALDAQSRMLMQEELLRIWGERRLSTLYVTHNIQEAVYLADRVVVLSRRPGRVISIISIDLPKFGRDKNEYITRFNGYVEQIWRLIRKDAEDALREGE